MRVVINCRSILLSHPTGIGRYTYNLLDQLGKIDNASEILLYAKKGLFDFKRKLPQFNYPNYKPVIDYFNGSIPKADIYHVPSPAHIDHFVGKVIVTIHDLIYKTYPQSHTQETIDLTEKYMQGIIARADMILCTSENTRQDLHRFFDVPQEKTRTVLNGVDHKVFFPIEDKNMMKSFLDSKGIGGEFILFVGTLEPRKNLLGVLEAMATMPRALPLVVVGMKGWMSENIISRVEQLGLKNKVIFTGFISDGELNFLYNSCMAFIFPSFYEGFGFPIVEAFAAGACVITSSTSSCKEIAKDAAILIDPNDPATIAQALGQVMADKALREKCKMNGLKRGQEFSFSQTAKNTREVYSIL